MTRQTTGTTDGVPEAPSPRVAVETNGINVIDACSCAGPGDDDHDRAIRIMGLYAPLVEIATTDEVPAGR